MKRNFWSRVFWSAGLLFSFGLLFTLFGPSLPARKAVETYPVFSPDPQPEFLTVYLEEFNRLRTNKLSSTRQPERFLGGTVLHRDKLTNTGTEVVLTHEGNSWTANQQLHYRKDPSAEWITLRCPVRVARAAYLLKPTDEPRILLLYDQKVATYDFRTGGINPLFQGFGLRLSPDRRWGSAYETIDVTGHYSLVIIDLDSLQMRKLFSMWEADPGSGTSFYCNWSADGKTLEFYGEVLLVDKVQDTHSAPIRKVRYVYLAEKGELYELSGVP